VFSPVFGGVRREEPVSEDVAAHEPEPAAPAREVAEPVEAPAYQWADAGVQERTEEPEAPAAELEEPEVPAAEPAGEWYDDALGGAKPITPVAEDEPVREPSSPPADERAYEPVDDWGDNPLGTPAAAFDEPLAPAAETTPEPAPSQVAPLAPVAMAQPAAESTGFGSQTEAPVRLTIRRPLSATPAAAALESDQVPDAGPPNTPIFGDLRSNWLNDDDAADASWTDNEVDRGWTAAGRADSAEAETEGHTRTGLPVRRPGGRLVPGGVSNEPTVVARDPDAIRNRLAAHAAGVSRGRAAAAAQPVSNDYAHEETGPA
jgi:hypothetical protein